MRKNQLVLIERSEADFHLDERTREMGRLGVAAAREVLRAAQMQAQAQAQAKAA